METVGTLIRSRIIDHKVVKAEDIKFHPLNWRVHPNGQIEAVEGVLQQVGIVQELIAYHSEREGGALTLIDGALRKGLGGEWPVTVTDLTDEEADLILATLHPTGDMAEMDSEKLGALLANIQMEAIESEAVADLLILLAKDTPAAFDDGNAPDKPGDEAGSINDFNTDQIGPHVRMVQLFFNEDNIVEFNRMSLALAKRFETTTLTETIMEAVKREYNQGEEAL